MAPKKWQEIGSLSVKVSEARMEITQNSAPVRLYVQCTWTTPHGPSKYWDAKRELVVEEFDRSPTPADTSFVADMTYDAESEFFDLTSTTMRELLDTSVKLELFMMQPGRKTPKPASSTGR